MGDLGDICIGALDKGERKICKDDCAAKLAYLINLALLKLTPLLNLTPPKLPTLLNIALVLLEIKLLQPLLAFLKKLILLEPYLTMY
jgi:hypothetical protein